MRFKNTTLIILTVAIVFSPFFASGVFAATKTFNAAVKTDVLVIRSGPGKNYRKVGRLDGGTVIKVLQQKNGWYRIAGNQWAVGQFLKKTTAKVTVIKSAEEIAPKDESAVVVDVDPASTGTASQTNLTTTCLRAIKKANSYCLSIASGCSSMSKTARCVEANQKCEARQEAALGLCPAAN